MEEIKVGDYVRTIYGEIAKITQVHPRIKGIKRKAQGLIDFNLIKKHSKNIIDLIEVGDYVNGREVKHIAMFEGFPDYLKLIFVDEKHLIPDDTCENNEIKTILTHEQFEQNSYKV